jgi:hypothetical protein
MGTISQISDSPLSRPATQAQMKAQLRDVFREAFDRLGGADWLVAFAQENDGNARVFVQAVTKLIPLSAKLDVSLREGDDLALVSTTQLRQILLSQIANTTQNVVDVDFENADPEPD